MNKKAGVMTVTLRSGLTISGHPDRVEDAVRKLAECDEIDVPRLKANATYMRSVIHGGESTLARRI